MVTWPRSRIRIASRARSGHHDLLEVLDRPGVAAPPHHVLACAELDQAGTGLGVAAPDRLHHPLDGMP